MKSKQIQKNSKNQDKEVEVNFLNWKSRGKDLKTKKSGKQIRGKALRKKRSRSNLILKSQKSGKENTLLQVITKILMQHSSFFIDVKSLNFLQCIWCNLFRVLKPHLKSKNCTSTFWDAVRWGWSCTSMIDIWMTSLIYVRF